MTEKASQGTFVWHDMMTNDPEKSKKFYTDLIGWTIQKMDMGEFGTYEMIHAGETGIGGFMKTDPECKAPSAWTVYISVDEIEA